MSEPEFDREEDPDSESMFDFLAEESNRPRVRKPENTRKGEKRLPIIRKPVPVSESGPLSPPKPGDPVEPPPQLTISEADDFDFLNDAPTRKADSAEHAKKTTQQNVTRLNPDTDSGSESAKQLPPASNDHLLGNIRAAVNDDLDLDDLDLGDRYDFEIAPNNGEHTNYGYHEAQSPSGRKRLLALAVFIILAAVGSLAFTQYARWWPIVESTVFNSGPSVEEPSSLTGSEAEAIPQPVESVVTDLSTDTNATDESAAGGFNVTTSPLMRLFREQLAELNELIASGSLDEAEQALSNMDRTIYGYGAFEFAEVEARIANLRNGVTNTADVGNSEEAQRLEQARLAEQSAEADAQRLEQARLAEQTAQAEAQRLERARLAEQTAQAEAQRLEQARLAEQNAQAEAQQLEQARLAEQAAQAEAERLEQLRLAEQAAQTETTRLEQARLTQLAANAEAQRLEQVRLAQLATDAKAAGQTGENSQIVDADRQATDRRIAEQRASNQRRKARELRLAQARERATAEVQEQLRQEAAAVAARVAKAGSNTAPTAQTIESPKTVALASQSITDADLQVVYKRFASLQQAVNARDINTVIALTQRSGTRVQQFLQMFENSVSIDSRIKNVSTRNATGEIHGTLQIRGVRRADGSEIQPPANVASISLTSKRNGSDWSAISW